MSHDALAHRRLTSMEVTLQQGCRDNKLQLRIRNMERYGINIRPNRTRTLSVTPALVIPTHSIQTPSWQHLQLSEQATGPTESRTTKQVSLAVRINAGKLRCNTSRPPAADPPSLLRARSNRYVSTTHVLHAASKPPKKTLCLQGRGRPFIYPSL